MSYLQSINTIIAQYHENQMAAQENNRLYNENMRRLIYLIEELYDNRDDAAAAASSTTRQSTLFYDGSGSPRRNRWASPRTSPRGGGASGAATAPQMQNIYTRQNPRSTTAGVRGGAGTSVPLLYLNTPNILRNILFNAFGATSAGGDHERTVPTEEEITNATEDLVYSSAEFINIETVCPISLETFREGATITRIRHCGHIFNRECLRRWFQTQSMCPVCRHNILSQPPPAASTSTATTTADESERITLETGDEEYEIDIISPNRRPSSTVIGGGGDDTTSALMRALIGMLDISGVTATNISNTRRTTEDGNVVDLLYELNVPLGNITNL